MEAQTDTTFDAVPAHMGAIAVMGSEGDIKYTWDPKKPEEVESARKHFNDLKAKGFLIFRMKRWARKDPVDTFDPKAGRLMFQAPEPAEPDGEVVDEIDPKQADRYVAVPAMAGG